LLDFTPNRAPHYCQRAGRAQGRGGVRGLSCLPGLRRGRRGNANATDRSPGVRGTGRRLSGRHPMQCGRAAGLASRGPSAARAVASPRVGAPVSRAVAVGTACEGESEWCGWALSGEPLGSRRRARRGSHQGTREAGARAGGGAGGAPECARACARIAPNLAIAS
jgi:hypothetical protein